MNASYNALQVTVERRFGTRFTLKGYYVFSKTFDGAQLQGATANGGVEDFNNLRLDRGLADTDQRHTSVTSLIWSPDYFEGNSRVLKNVLNGWLLSGIVTLQSGFPFNVTSGVDSNVDGNNNDRPNVIGNPRLDPHRSNAATNWFNAAAFSAAPTGTDGLARRNLLTGPGFRDIDAGIVRDFKLFEPTVLEFRAEFTNIFNMVSLGAPTAVLTSPIVGQIRSSASTSRRLQLGLRLTF
jgi:hypothetical protein